MIRNACVFDAETTAIADVLDYQDDIARPPARMKDPEKIAEWIENAKAKQLNLAATYIDLARVVCLCWTFDGRKLNGGIAEDEEQEKALIARFWKETHPGKTYNGFNILDFDLPLLIRRSQYLDIPYPDIEVGRYRHRGVEDTMQILSMDGKINYRKLEFYCKRFKIKSDIKDEFSGADTPGLVLMKKWDDIKRHCAADVQKEWRLAERIGLIEWAGEPTEAF